MIFSNIDHNIHQFEEAIAEVNSRLEAGSADEIDLARYKALKCQ